MTGRRSSGPSRRSPVPGRRSSVGRPVGACQSQPPKGFFIFFRILFQNEPKCAEMSVLQRKSIRKMRHAESLIFKDQWLEGRSVAGRRSSGPSRRSSGPGRRSSVHAIGGEKVLFTILLIFLISSRSVPKRPFSKGKV